VALLNSEVDFSLHSPPHDHSNKHGFRQRPLFNRLSHRFAHQVAPQTPSENGLKMDTLLDMPLKIDLSHFFADSVLGIDI